jgi:protocatechuate 3,4-dioxygenase beta subunit
MSRTRSALAEVVEKSYPNIMKQLFFTIAILAISFQGLPEWAAHAATCMPTEEDALGPFYKPNTPVRSSVGKGYVLQGVVRSSKDCAAVPGVAIELWLAGPDGGYDDAHRATIIADASGAYRFESSVPPPYYGRPPHIHLRVSAKEFKTLVTQHYPVSGKKEALFDIILVPSR